MVHLAMCQSDDAVMFTAITVTLKLVENKLEQETVSCLAGLALTCTLSVFLIA